MYTDSKISFNLLTKETLKFLFYTSFCTVLIFMIPIFKFKKRFICFIHFRIILFKIDFMETLSSLDYLKIFQLLCVSFYVTSFTLSWVQMKHNSRIA